MTNAMITRNDRIRASHPVRNDFSDCSSGNGHGSYYDTKGHAVRAFEAVLNDYDLCFDPADCMDMPGDDGYMLVEVWTNDPLCTVYVGVARLAWHRMDCTGRWEFVGYLA